jgi:hypothetical protein
MSYASIVKHSDTAQINTNTHQSKSSKSSKSSESSESSKSSESVNSYESSIYTEAQFYPLIPLADIQEKQRVYLNKKMGIIPIKISSQKYHNDQVKHEPKEYQPQQTQSHSLRELQHACHQEPSVQSSPTNSNSAEITTQTHSRVVDTLDVKEIMKNINIISAESQYNLIIKNQQQEIKQNMEQIENYQTFIKTQSDLISKQEKTLSDLLKKINKNNLIVENNEKTITEQTANIESYNKQIMDLKLQYTSILSTNQTLQQQNIVITQQIQQYQQHLAVIQQQLVSHHTLLQQIQQTSQPQPYSQPQIIYPQQPPPYQPSPYQPSPYQPPSQQPSSQQQPTQYLTPEMSIAMANAMAQMMVAANPS